MSYRRSRGFDVRVSLVSIFVSALACSAEPPRALPPRAPSAPPPQPPVVWSRLAEVRSWPPAGEPFANSGHAGAGPRAVVRVSPDARATYARLVKDSELPDGAVVALFHELADGRAGRIYVMQKTGTTWGFSMYEADGVEIASARSEAGSTARCRRCHLDSVADSLFGLPRHGAAP